MFVCLVNCFCTSAILVPGVFSYSLVPYLSLPRSCVWLSDPRVASPCSPLLPVTLPPVTCSCPACLPACYLPVYPPATRLFTRLLPACYLPVYPPATCLFTHLLPACYLSVTCLPIPAIKPVKVRRCLHLGPTSLPHLPKPQHNVTLVFYKMKVNVHVQVFCTYSNLHVLRK